VFCFLLFRWRSTSTQTSHFKLSQRDKEELGSQGDKETPAEELKDSERETLHTFWLHDYPERLEKA